jgi:hypothetical protein
MTEKQKFWHAHIESQEKSGLTRQQYCSEHGLNLVHMGYYAAHFRKTERRERRKSGFVKVSQPASSLAGIVVRFSSGTVIECPPVPSVISEVVKSLV